MAKVKFSERKLRQYLSDAKTVKFLRRNPVIACELLLGIKLSDAQKWMLIESWNRPYVLWNCSRNFGKSFLGAIIIMLKAMLYPNQRIYIVSSSGGQAQETFGKMEDIAKCNIDSIDFTDSYTGRNIDIFMNEIIANANSDGFVHDKTSYRVVLFNGSRIYTLNSIPQNVRGKRSTLLFLDESCFCTEELITAVLPFLTQDSQFKTSINKNFDIKKNRRKVPNQVIWASSAGDADHLHAKTYKEYALRMVAGDDNYFVADMPCDIPLNPLIDGEPTTPYLTQETIDNEMRINPDKCMREYYNKFQRDGGQNQLIKWAQVRRNEAFDLPKLTPTDNDELYGIAYDPARMHDNSIIGVMQYKYDEKIGWYGEVSNFINLVDLANKKKIPMKTPDQINVLRNMIVEYNGSNPDYKNIDNLSIDAGAGGGGVGISDWILEDWYDSFGTKHKGFIDKNFEAHQNEISKFPNAWDGLNLISPQKYKSQMCLELSELMHLDLIKFPREYNGKGFVVIQKGDIIENRPLTFEEEIALINIDALKTELTSIYKLGDNRYGLQKDKERKLHDDRFYVLLMLAHGLYKLRQDDQLNRTRRNDPTNYSDYFLFNLN